MSEEESDDRTIEISIEALTGTVYDLCVSPYETILGIKLKVQRLEGIPVYQQQLVWGDTELQDEFCLEEYCISSGAQLKLMVAMRGGPIHAQRVHVDMEDEAFLEIAEFLDNQQGDKFAFMLLRSGDDLEHASIVQVQMMDEEDSMEAVRLSPIHMSESTPLGVAASKTSQLENALTRDKMKLLMSKLKKGKSTSYHHHHHHHHRHQQQQQAQNSLQQQLRPGQISRSGTGKVLIVENRAPSRVLTPSHRSARRSSSLACTHPVESSRRVDRKLVYHHGDEEAATAGHVICSGGAGQRALSSHRTRSYDPEQDTPIITRKTASRLGRISRPHSRATHDDHATEAPPSNHTHNTPGGSSQPCATGLINCRKRRTSELDADVPRFSADLARLHLTTPSHANLPAKDGSGPYDQRMLRLGQEKSRGEPVPKWSDKPAGHLRKATPSNLSKHQLPPLVPPHKSKSTVTAPQPHPSTSRNTRAGHLPPLPGTTSVGKEDSVGMARKKRCMQCGKRMGLASTYSCRCGGLFCAVHRYAESHMCSFDYKSEGRRLLTRTNPVIAAQKLPKI